MAVEHGHILVVDDNRMNRMKLSISLEQQGHTVGLAEDGQQALDLLEAQPFDAVLLDIEMPRMDGHQVLTRMKDDPRLRDVPVIVISASDELDTTVRCIEMGAEDYLPKPFNPVLLKARLNASLRKKKLRDMEQAFLRQELTLRQSEKLATLGRLSAGMAHELNNPAAAAQRGAAHLQAAFARLQQAHLKLSGLGLTAGQLQSLLPLDVRSRDRAARPVDLSSLARADRESDLETWLDAQGVGNAWEVAPALVSLGFERQELSALVADLVPSQVPIVVDWIYCTYTVYSLLEEVSLGTRRISELVKALKAYSYLDQGPVQTVDIHEGLDNTLLILRSKLKSGVTVHREYAADLPHIQAYGSELNQVWTNLIDNAIDAMGGRGEITLRTRHDDHWAIVEVEDDGPGIPDSVRPKLFDPFFTTKPPGKGTGLGLSISHSIVVEKHKGRIDVYSQPGKTRFEVRLPIEPAVDG